MLLHNKIKKDVNSHAEVHKGFVFSFESSHVFLTHLLHNVLNCSFVSEHNK